MKVLFITPGPITWASSRFRAYWPAEYMQDAQVIEYDHLRTEDLDAADATIWIKSGQVETMEELVRRGKKVWFDLCDPAWWFEPGKTRRIVDVVNGVSFSNPGLAADFVEWYETPKQIRVVPDRLKLEHYPKRRCHSTTSPIRLIWFGGNQNRIALFSALIPLDRLQANGYQIELTILDDHPESVWSFDNKYPIYNVRWSLEKENAIISAHDIALLPPYPGPWGRVKSDNKFQTAWACGLPVTEGLSYHDLERLVMFSDLRQECADMGFESLEPVEQSARDWEAILA